VGPAGQALDAAKRWAAQILECAPLSVRASKRVALDSLARAGEREAIETRYDPVETVLKSEDFIEGPKAFAAKRKPTWKAR
jgi:enoyl-CoA hydratase/carnithine racemase